MESPRRLFAGHFHAMTKCEKVEDTDVPVLLLGESGTEKSVFYAFINNRNIGGNKIKYSYEP